MLSEEQKEKKIVKKERRESNALRETIKESIHTLWDSHNEKRKKKSAGSLYKEILTNTRREVDIQVHEAPRMLIGLMYAL